jgi:hypothetical protein
MEMLVEYAAKDAENKTSTGGCCGGCGSGGDSGDGGGGGNRYSSGGPNEEGKLQHFERLRLLFLKWYC